ncbi:MAG: hypothetical protein PF541_03115 [Prolixibacteraceae bacterium]|jgi:hypothetical protein|nr:hypothetical protein [Prolixibacteraceae bacterium]
MKTKTLILISMSLALFSSCVSTKSIFKKEVQERFQEPVAEKRLITKKDLNKLPTPVANYLEYCGWLNREVPENFHLKFTGEFSLKEGKYVKIKSDQYSWFNRPTRLFYIQNWMIGGRHKYDKEGAFMLIKLFGRLKIVDAKGTIMDQSELVTYLNDMFIIAPGALVDAPITWETIDAYSVKASITQFGYTVSASIYFNEKWELVNFISYDRYTSSDGIKSELLPWSTPMKNYIEIDGIKVPSYGEAIWHYSDRDWVYAKFDVKDVKWNLFQMIKK